jgi:hypothetical protein
MGAGSTSSDDSQGYRRRLLSCKFDISSDSEEESQHPYLAVDEECISSDDTQGYRRRLLNLNIALASSDTAEEDSMDSKSLSNHSDASFHMNDNDEYPHGTSIDADKDCRNSEVDMQQQHRDSNRISILQRQEMSSAFPGVHCIVLSPF